VSASQPLGEVADIIRGISFPKDAKSLAPRAGNVACLRTTNVQREVEWDDLWFVPTTHVKRPEQFVQSGDILISTANSYELVGKVALVSGLPRPATLGAFISLIRPRPGTNPKYLYFQLAWGKTQSRIRETASTTTNISNVSSKKLAALELDLPEPDEQRRIVAELEKQLSRLDQAIANLKRVKANLDRYAAATLAEAFAGRWGGDADDWRTVPLREVANVQLGQQRAPIHAADLNPIPYIRAANVTWRGIDVSDVKSMGFPNPARYRLAFGDILLAEASGSASEVGKPAVWRDEVPGACYQKTLIRIRCNPERLSYQFAYYFFLHTCLSGQFARLAPGVGILHLTAERMLVWPTVAPPLQIQASIVAELDRRLSIVREVEAAVDANLKRAKALRQAVLAKAFG
jgi:type I restriction enzyme S subunit